jgi:two-component system, NtrC family, response regulator AlgB
LEASDGGTAFLDEIAELSPGLQTKFLRFLQDERFERIGGDRTIQVDARIVAATNRNLRQEVIAGRFRTDLYYRLNVISLQMPALRERREDILPLSEIFLAEAAARNARRGIRFSDEAREALTSYCWPGNIRELRNAVERAVILGRGSILRKEDLPDTIFKSNSPRDDSPYPNSTLEEVERDHIQHVLAMTPKLEDAAARLGIGIATLWRKRKRHHLK